MANNIIVSDLLGEEIYNKLKLKAVSGERWLKKKVSVPRIQKPGLLLTCLLGKLHPDRILIFGKAELGYLKNLSARSLEPVLRCLEKTPSP